MSQQNILPNITAKNGSSNPDSVSDSRSNSPMNKNLKSNNANNNNNNNAHNNTVKLEIPSSAFSNIKSNNPPKIIMLPDSLQANNYPQKRRRVVRACDRCRKLKIKCSGDLPCIHCTVYSYECTYDQPNRSKKKNNSSNALNQNPSKKVRKVSTPIDTKSLTPIAPSTTTPDNISKNVTVNKNTNNTNTSTNINNVRTSTVSKLASSNPVLFSKLTDRLKLYDDILHQLLPEIKLTDLNDNPKPINPMKLMSALNKMREMGKPISKSSSKQISKIYDSLPEMPLPNLPLTKLPPNSSTSLSNTFNENNNSNSNSNNNNNNNTNTNNNSNVITNNNLGNLNSSSQIPPQLQQQTNDNLINNQFQGIDGSLESSMGKEIKIILPSREVALDLITKTWENACVLFRFYHRVAFIEDLNELYDTDPNQYTNKQQRFLPLVYSVMACGALFYKSDENTNYEKNKYNNGEIFNNDNSNNENNKNDDNYNYIQKKDFEDEGYKYFIAARKLIDITDTRDTYGIQTIVMLIIFLQCSARLSTCYAYIGIALRAALREGLHRKLDYPFNPIELEIRKRLFWTIYKMDIYVNTMLGLPRTISSDDFDQDMPIELDDENITVNGYRYDRQGDRLSSSGIANAHTRLIFVMKEVVTKLYPIKPKKSINLVSTNSISNNTSTIGSNDGSPSNLKENNSNNNNSNNNNNEFNENHKQKNDLIRNNFVYDLELKLQDWMNSLPLELKPGVEPPHQYLKANRLLHISYLHVKIILYRPFIHYISANIKSNSLNDLACIEKAKNCINVARIVVKLAEDMINKNMLSGSYWFSIYTIFFSVACLVYYVHFAPSINKEGKLDQEYISIKKDAENGKKVLDILKDSSMAARRTYNILNALFEQLNRKTARAGNNNVSNQFVPAHMGTNEFSKRQRTNNRNFSNNDYNYKFKKYSNDYQFNNDINEDNEMSNENSTGNIDFMNNFNTTATNTNITNNNNNNNNNNNSPISSNSNSYPNMQVKLNNYLNKANTNGSFNNNSTSSKSKNDKNKSRATFNDITDYKYVPGPMDQMDMKIFGRFLPPYMLNKGEEKFDYNNSHNKNGNLNEYSDIGIDDLNIPIETNDNEKIKEEDFSPNFEFFNESNTNNSSKNANPNANASVSVSASASANENMNEDEGIKERDSESNLFDYERGDKDVNIKDEGKEGEDDNDWAKNELLKNTTNEFFNQVTTANAIPSGLSTVFQSENDKSNNNFEENLEKEESFDNRGLPSRFTSIEGIGMLDELLFGSGWDIENESQSQNQEQNQSQNLSQSQNHEQSQSQNQELSQDLNVKPSGIRDTNEGTAEPDNV